MRKRSPKNADQAMARAGRLSAAIGNRPREFVGLIMATAAVVIIFANMLFLQKGPHPAPIFAARPVSNQIIPPVRPQAAVPLLVPDSPTPNRGQLIGDIQRELSRKGYYDGAADGIWGAKTDAAARDFIQGTGAKINAEASEALLRAVTAAKARNAGGRAGALEPARKDPIAELIAPPRQVLAIQLALADFGYGQIKPTGNLDPATSAAIEKFERDRRLPITGQMSDQFVRELAGVTGRPLE